MALSSIREAILKEIKVLAADQKRLQHLLNQLGEEVASDTIVGKRRGRRSKAEKQAASDADVKKALSLIEEAGKGGVKAIKLSYLLKNEGHSLPTKADLINTEKVKTTGKGGGTTYVYLG